MDDAVDFDTLDEALLPLLVRNIATDGFPFTDPDPQNSVDGAPAVSLPGAILASPSFRVGGATDDPRVDQDYVYNWVRDAAIAIVEVAARHDDPGRAEATQTLQDYVSFAAAGQRSAPTTSDGLAVACFTIDGRPRSGWPAQNDGPALQGLALLELHPRLDPPTRAMATELIGACAEFVLERWQEPNTNLWEEVAGFSFFTRSVQLRFVEALRRTRPGIAAPPGLEDVAAGLRAALDTHWDDALGCYRSILEPSNPRPGYDPNIDIVMAAVYGAVPVADPRLLATAALLRTQWAGPPADGAGVYPINPVDAATGLGPVLGRYPGDVYDGDDTGAGSGHPWFVATANMAEFSYRLAAEIRAKGTIPDAPRTFWDPLGVVEGASAAEHEAALRASGDRMLRAVVHHSDHLELSEQLDARTGFQRSVHNLTWSYAAVLSALRARRAHP